MRNRGLSASLWFAGTALFVAFPAMFAAFFAAVFFSDTSFESGGPQDPRPLVGSVFATVAVLLAAAPFVIAHQAWSERSARS